MKHARWGLVAVALLSGGCAERNAPMSAVMSPQVEAVQADSLQSAGPQLPGYVLTPAGWFHSSCVHVVPSGARVSIDHVVTLPDGTSYQIAKCLFPARMTLPRAQSQLPVPSTTHWLEDDYALAGAGNSYRAIVASWHVPPAPTQHYTINDAYFTFPGLQRDSFIIQPVLQYGYSNPGGGNLWALASWHCDGPSGECEHSDLVAASPGDSIFGQAATYPCSAGLCEWIIYAWDVTNGNTSWWVQQDSDTYVEADGGVVETTAFSSCDFLPATSINYTGVFVYDRYGMVTPTWWDHYPTNPNPDCGLGVTHTATTATLYQGAPSVAALITNPSPPRQNQPFSLTINGGSFDPTTVNAVYKLEGCGYYCQLVINNSAFSVKTQNQLVVPSLTLGTAGTWDFQVRNTSGGPLSPFVPLTVLPPAPPPPDSVVISGPSVVRPNASCTWSATVVRGVPPYQYSWVPSGIQWQNEVTESWSAPGTLRVTVIDSTGNHGNASFNIDVSTRAPMCQSMPVR